MDNSKNTEANQQKDIHELITIKMYSFLSFLDKELETQNKTTLPRSSTYARNSKPE